MALHHEIEACPPFHDLDPMGVVWHGYYPKYLEIARCALLAKFNYDYPEMQASGYAWPVVEMHLKYVRSLHYNQRVRVRAEVVEYENRLKIAYVVRDAKTEDILHKAHTVQVAVNISTQKMCYVSPDILFERLGLSK